MANSKFGNVFSSNTTLIEVKIDNSEVTDKPSITSYFSELIETKGAAISSDLNVDERDVYSDPFKRRTATGGKAFDIKFTSVLSPGNEAHDFLRGIAYSSDITKHNDNEVRFVFPNKDASNKQRTETYKGVFKFDAIGPGDALDLAKLEYSLMVSGAPIVGSIEDTEIVESDLNVKFSNNNNTGTVTYDEILTNAVVFLDKAGYDGNLSNGEVVYAKVVANDGYLVNGKAYDEFNIVVSGLSIPVVNETIDIDDLETSINLVKTVNVANPLTWDISFNNVVGNVDITSSPTSLIGIAEGTSVTFTFTARPNYSVNNSNSVTKTYDIPFTTRDETVASTDLAITQKGIEGSIEVEFNADVANGNVKVSTTDPVTNLSTGDTVAFTLTPEAHFTVNGKSTDTIEYTVVTPTTARSITNRK